MALQEAEQCADRTACAHGGREAHRRAVAAFLARREELAAGRGVPAALAHSPVASRQWVSDELAQSARAVTARGRAAGEEWTARVRRASLLGVGGGLVALLLAQAFTAIGAGWTTARTCALLAAVLTAAALLAAALAHRARGGLLAPLLGEDNRLSTSRTVAAAWLLFAGHTVLLLALCRVAGAGPVDLGLNRGAGLLTVFALVSVTAVAVRRIVLVRVLGRRLQKVRADRPRAADLLCDDGGRACLADVQYVLVSAVALVYAAAELAGAPARLPQLPWSLVVLVGVSTAGYLAGKGAEGGRPVVLSVVRAREAGDLDAPIRIGDDIEIRGAGFVPPGAAGPEALTRLVVRIGPVHTHVPLVPVPGGFANPTDGVLTVPLPADVEPGRVEVSVVTAAGLETDRVTIDVAD
ncbi:MULTISPECIES: hypothetical protein [Streptomyces]|uniref:Integral membrane protein n=1 Tax=Streptomyces solicathayae TaxID=3081768 RepID=A0ABZ0LSX7_9ACTN|nr:hypothetical protein [Streptomyces sp. HUAS YS2]WOX22599.1 hypothetical protein R2D22_14805 [Streptomyces sp. HUAS YS2]